MAFFCQKISFPPAFRANKDRLFFPHLLEEGTLFLGLFPLFYRECYLLDSNVLLMKWMPLLLLPCLAIFSNFQCEEDEILCVQETLTKALP